MMSILIHSPTFDIKVEGFPDSDGNNRQPNSYTVHLPPCPVNQPVNLPRYLVQVNQPDVLFFSHVDRVMHYFRESIIFIGPLCIWGPIFGSWTWSLELRDFLLT